MNAYIEMQRNALRAGLDTLNADKAKEAMEQLDQFEEALDQGSFKTRFRIMPASTPLSAKTLKG